MPDQIELVVEPRDDGTYDLVRRHGDEAQVLSHHEQRAMAESERFRLAQAGANEADWSGETGEVGDVGAYPDNTGG